MIGVAELKRAIKDSVFTYLFRQPEYMRELYLVLHPEDTDVTEEELKLVTLENVLTTGQYNDLGFQVRDKLILLVEAQSTFSVNLPLRMLLYLAATYKEYIEENKLYVYGKKAVRVPRPELYVVYTGQEKSVPRELRFSDLYEGAGDVEVTVKVLGSDGSGDILDQYVEFCEVVNEQRGLYGYTEKTIHETMRICQEKGILVPFLMSREKEVLDLMTTLFDQEKLWEIEKYHIAQSAEQRGIKQGMERGMQQGMERGMQQGMQQERTNLLRQMLRQTSLADVSRLTGIPATEIQRLIQQ